MKGGRGFADAGSASGAECFSGKGRLFLWSGETVLFENALREAAVAVNIHGYELFFPAALTGEDDPAAAELGLSVHHVNRSPVTAPAPENIVYGIDEPAH